MQVLTVDCKSSTAPADFARSLHETGFAVLKNHSLDWHLIEAIYKEWEAFFHDERRHDYYFSEEVQDGYYPSDVSEVAKGETVKDIKEFYHLYFPHGRYPDFISNNAKKYFEQAIALGQQLSKWIEGALPENIKLAFDEPMSEIIEPSRTLLRVLYYPPQTGEVPAGAIRAAAHGDINWITVLPAATEAGLQVQDKQGNWLDVKADPETVVINIGDMLQEATQGYYISTTHRVINPTAGKQDKARLSLPMFIHPRADIKLSNRYTAGSYLRERLIELGHITEEGVA